MLYSVSGVVTVRGIAHDSDGAVEFVEVRVDNMSWSLADGNTSWSYGFDTGSVSNGVHSVFARCYDGYNYSEVRFVNVSVVNLAEIVIDSISGGLRVSADITNTGTVVASGV